MNSTLKHDQWLVVQKLDGAIYRIVVFQITRKSPKANWYDLNL